MLPATLFKNLEFQQNSERHSEKTYECNKIYKNKKCSQAIGEKISV